MHARRFVLDMASPQAVVWKLSFLGLLVVAVPPVAPTRPPHGIIPPVAPTRPPHGIITTDCARLMLDVVFVLDASTSVTEPNFQLMLDFLMDLLSVANIDGGSVRVGVVIYSTDVFIQFHLNEYNNKRDMYRAIQNIPYKYGSTNTADALKTVREEMFVAAQGDREGVLNVCILITDGVSDINSRRTIPEGEAARDAGILMYVIGIGLTDTREVDGIASRPVDEYRFIVDDFSDLGSVRDKVLGSPGFCCGTCQDRRLWLVGVVVAVIVVVAVVVGVVVWKVKSNRSNSRGTDGEGDVVVKFSAEPL